MGLGELLLKALNQSVIHVLLYLTFLVVVVVRLLKLRRKRGRSLRRAACGERVCLSLWEPPGVTRGRSPGLRGGGGLGASPLSDGDSEREGFGLVIQFGCWRRGTRTAVMLRSGSSCALPEVG